MYSLLLLIIYLAFISLGLPDSLIGSAWSIMHTELDVPLSFAGVLTMIIAGSTIASSLCTNTFVRKFGTGWVTSFSVLLTAIALFGFSISNSFELLCIWAIPYGFGAGAVDAVLNNYVALHYTSRHMSWLHCFWGIGATIGPYIMGICLTQGMGWLGGYRVISYIQIVLAVVLFVTLPLWKRKEQQEIENVNDRLIDLKLAQLLKMKGVKYALISFFAYCSVEATAGLWASCYLVQYKGIGIETAARFASLFYLGITLGRALCGFIANKLGDRLLIRIGFWTVMTGIGLILFPIEYSGLSLTGLVIMGFGCAPVYPSLIHATPDNFGKSSSQSVIGVQMASSYLATTFMPPLFGWIAECVHMGLYPCYLLLLALLFLWSFEMLNKAVKR